MLFIKRGERIGEAGDSARHDELDNDNDNPRATPVESGPRFHIARRPKTGIVRDDQPPI
jgi:hypothetical protein